MSYPILPTLPFSLKSGVHKTPHFSSIVQKTAAMMGNSGISLSPFPTWDYVVNLVHVDGTLSDASAILDMFVGMFIQCNGQANLFLMIDPNDNTVTAMPFAIGDGTSVNFQLTRSIGGVGIDVIQNVNGTPTIYINGTPTSSFTTSDTGIITFGTAPTLGATLSWSGNFYMLCRFSDDILSGLTLAAFKSGGQQLWDCDSIKFSTEFVPQTSAGAVVNGVVYEIVDGGTF
jgi:hypothetical protein